MRLVGLTGGIASGKSTVSRQLDSQGVPIIDADEVAKAALRQNTWGYRRVVSAFGTDIVQEDGEVDRKMLGELVFSDPDKRRVLNKAMEPCIALGLFIEVAKHWALGTAVVVLDAPLLFEAKLDKFTQPIVVVWVDRRTQEARLMNRDRISIEQANNRINAQLSLDVKRERADIVIDNSGSLEVTKLKVAELKKEISGPPTWKELAFSRFGVAGIIVGFLTLVSRLR